MSEENGKEELIKTMDTYKDVCLMVIMEGALTGNMDRLKDGMTVLDLIERVNGCISDLENAFNELNDKLSKILDMK